MRTVKAARFNAAERLERKHTLSLFAMSMVSLYFVGLSVWQAVYASLIDAAPTGCSRWCRSCPRCSRWCWPSSSR